YALFIWTQLERLWIDTLPVVFKQAEQLVKRGFWQLIFISCINIVFFFIYYKRTGPVVQGILTAFNLASLLIVLSAAERMYLYIKFHGFSYEKFIASYTVLYCVIVFIWLSICLFRVKKHNIFKFLVALFLWMYSILIILPVEQITFRTNVALLTLPGSRINLHELQMFSNDVMPLVKQYNGGEVWKKDWQRWIIVQETRNAEKAWYERNLSNIINK
ncbi:MAG: DUF4173 domain-containing protein, partial [Nitrospirae bacterium]|nr:DUF4173 domain-containing protein [Nitrospirota bacterium]